MATSFRKSFIENAGSEKNVYANKVFCAWDFGISKAETADLKSKSIQTEFKVTSKRFELVMTMRLQRDT